VVKETNYRGLIANRKELNASLVNHEDFFPIIFCFTLRNCGEIRGKEREREPAAYHDRI